MKTRRQSYQIHFPFESRVFQPQHSGKDKQLQIALSLRSSVKLTCSSVLFPPLPHFLKREKKFRFLQPPIEQIVDHTYYLIATYQVTERKLIIAIIESFCSTRHISYILAYSAYFAFDGKAPKRWSFCPFTLKSAFNQSKLLRCF